MSDWDDNDVQDRLRAHEAENAQLVVDALKRCLDDTRRDLVAAQWAHLGTVFVAVGVIEQHVTEAVAAARQLPSGRPDLRLVPSGGAK